MEQLDPLQKARLRQLKRQQVRAEAEQREKDNAARIRKLERENATRQAFLLGTTIRDATLSEQERLVVAEILNRRSDKPSDWDRKLSQWLTARRQEVLPDFAPVRPKIGELRE